jgi:hypothetical protein
MSAMLAQNGRRRFEVEGRKSKEKMRDEEGTQEGSEEG